MCWTRRAGKLGRMLRVHSVSFRSRLPGPSPSTRARGLLSTRSSSMRGLHLLSGRSMWHCPAAVRSRAFPWRRLWEGMPFIRTPMWQCLMRLSPRRVMSSGLLGRRKRLTVSSASKNSSHFQRLAGHWAGCWEFCEENCQTFIRTSWSSFGKSDSLLTGTGMWGRVSAVSWTGFGREAFLRNIFRRGCSRLRNTLSMISRRLRSMCWGWASWRLTTRRTRRLSKRLWMRLRLLWRLLSGVWKPLSGEPLTSGPIRGFARRRCWQIPARAERSRREQSGTAKLRLLANRLGIKACRMKI